MTAAQDRRWLRFLRRMRSQRRRDMLAALGITFEQLAAAVAAQVAAGSTDPPRLDIESVRDLLADAMTEPAEQTITSAFDTTAEIYRLETTDDEREASANVLLGLMRGRLLGAARTVRRDARRVIAANEQAPNPLDQIELSARVELTISRQGRSRRIATTEVVILSNEGELDAVEAGGVQFMNIRDGPGCGWTFHRDPDIADGSVRRVRDARNWPLAHPNCVRRMTPAVP